MCVYLRSRLLHGSTTSITSRTYDDVPEISRDCLSQTILNTCTSDKYDSFMGRHMSAKYGVCRPKNTHHKLVSPALDGGGLLLRHITWWMTSRKECSGFYISVVAVCCALTV